MIDLDPIPLDVRPRSLADTLDANPRESRRMLPSVVIAIFIVTMFCSLKASRWKQLLTEEWEPLAYFGAIVLVAVSFTILGKLGDHGRNRL